MSGYEQREHARQYRSVRSTYLSVGREILSLIGAAVGVSYAFGFIIVNVRLFVYGIYEPGLLRVRYLGAGMLFVVIMAMAAVRIALEVRRILTESGTASLRADLPTHAKALAQCILLAAAVIYAAGSVGSLMSAGQTYWLEWAREMATCGAAWLLIVLLPSAAFAILLTREWRAERPSSTWLLFWITSIGFTIPVAYAALVYPVLPPPVGGGASLKVHLLFDPDHADDFKRLGIPLQDANLSGPLCLMDETDKVYIVHSYERDACGRAAMEIDRGAVLGVLYPREKPP